MSVNLKSLKETFGKLTTKFKNTTSVTIEDITVKMDLITPQQEAESQKYALEILSDLKDSDDASQPHLLMYWDRMRTRLLSFAIKELNGEVLPDYIETGEFTKERKPIKMERSKALLGIIQEWTRPLVHSFFFSYGKMAEEAEIEADKYISYSSKNVDTHIELLEARLERLKQSKIQQVTTAVSNVTSQVESINKIEETRRQERQDIIASPSPRDQPSEEPTEPEITDTDIEAMMSSPIKKPVTPTEEPRKIPDPPVNSERGSFSKPVADESVNYIPPVKTDDAPEFSYDLSQPKNKHEKVTPMAAKESPEALSTLSQIKRTVEKTGMDQFLSTIQPKDQTFVRRYGLEKYASALDDGSIVQWRQADAKKKPMPAPLPHNR
jgi:hypothetical protein